MDKVIKIECTGTENIDLDMFKEFQGDLKTLSDQNFKKLKKSILKYGFSFPMFVWQHEDKNYIIDAHQRKKTLLKLRKEGYNIPPLPTVFINAKDRVEAKEKLLQLNSSYGEITKDGLYDFLDEPGMDFLEFKDDFELPEIDMLEFENKYFKEDVFVKGEKRPEGVSVLKKAGLEELKPSNYEHKLLKGKKILIEYSGGKDSSSVAFWVKHFYPESEIELVFVEMGMNHPGMNTFVYDFAQYLDAKISVITTQNMMDYFLEKGKWPHFMFPYCHKLMHGALKEKYFTYRKEKIVIARGGRLQEKSKKGKFKEDRFFKLEEVKNYTFFQPFYFTSKDVGAKILTENKLPIWGGYETGLQRTACRICPGQSIRTYACIKNKYPGVWDELLWLEKRLGLGCWQDPQGKGRASFITMADRGEAYLEKLS